MILSRYDLEGAGGRASDNVREDLTDDIYNISPTECPFTTNMGRRRAKNTFVEWQTDELLAVDASNARADGEDLGSNQGAPSSKIGNYHQISGKDLIVTGRAESVNKAGRSSEISYQLAKLSKSLKRDIETIALLTGQAARPGAEPADPASPAGTDAMLTASVGCWLKTNTARTGTEPSLSGTTYGYPDTPPGTLTGTEALSESGILSLVRSAWEAGGQIDMIMLNPEMKQRFSAYMLSGNARAATQYQDQGTRSVKAGRMSGGVLVKAAVGVYDTDFGVIDVVPNRFTSDVDAYLFDSQMWALCYLRGYFVKRIAETGDAMKRLLLVDWAVVSKNEASSAVFSNVDASAPMVA